MKCTYVSLYTLSTFGTRSSSFLSFSLILVLLSFKKNEKNE